MSGRYVALVLPLCVAACGPEIDPQWLLTAPRELAIEVEVVSQGRYGERLRAGPRTYRDALPLDTLLLRPVVVDENGPLDLSTLEGTWTLCEGFGNCLGRASMADRPQCDGDTLFPDPPCRFSNNVTTTLTLGEIPTDLIADPETELSLFSLLGGPTVGFLASTEEGPGLDTCIQWLDDREPLPGCLLVERILGIGPLGEAAQYLESLGIDPGLDEEADTLLKQPRNRNPAVEWFTLLDGSREVAVARAGSRLRVEHGQDIGLVVQVTEDDLDTYEVDGDAPEPLIFFDRLRAQWWFDREIDLVDTAPDGITVRLRPNGQSEARAYVVLRDHRGGESWGWVDLEFPP